MKIRRADLPEPPPKGYDALGMHPAYHVERLPSREEVDKACREAGVDAADAYNRRFIAACVIAAKRAVIMPKEGINDPAKDADTLRHEYPHTWGASHGSGGRGWLDASGRPINELSPAQAGMMLSMARSVIPQRPGLMTATTQAAPPADPTAPPRGMMTGRR